MYFSQHWTVYDIPLLVICCLMYMYMYSFLYYCAPDPRVTLVAPSDLFPLYPFVADIVGEAGLVATGLLKFSEMLTLPVFA